MLQADRVVPTTCPYCGVGCQIDLHIKDSMIYRVNGRFDNNVNHGFLCVKGRFGYDYVHSPDRLKHPLLRTDKTADNKPIFEPAPWRVALCTIATRLREIRHRNGPDSIAFLTSAKCTNEENYLLQKLSRAVIGTNNIDHCARL